MRNVFRGRFADQDWWVSRTNEVACLFPDEKDCRYYHRLGGDEALRFMAARGTWLVPVEMVERLPDPNRVAEGPLVFTSRGKWEDVNAKMWERFRVLEHELTGLAATVDRLIDRVYLRLHGVEEAFTSLDNRVRDEVGELQAKSGGDQ